MIILLILLIVTADVNYLMDIIYINYTTETINIVDLVVSMKAEYPNNILVTQVNGYSSVWMLKKWVEKGPIDFILLWQTDY